VAKIIAGVASSHVPAIGAAIDNKQTEEPYWQRVFSGFEKSKEWMEKTKPDVCIVIYNDHASAFSVEIVPTFALGCAEEFPPADEGWGPRPVPVVQGHPELASHIAQSVILDEFDLTICNKMEVDHGLTVPMNLLFGSPKAWPCPVIPLAVNVVLYPPPTAHRCYMLGKAIRRAVESYPEDLRVVIFGTGGMSHQISGPRAGLINSKFDKAFLDNLTKDPRKLTRITHLELMREAGATILCCTPTYALRLAEVANEIGFDIDSIPMKATVHAGEPGANIPATKQRIEDAWTAKCFDHAGASEVGAHSFECHMQPGGTHLIESEYIAEVINPLTGEAVAPGERGELVITNLGRWGFPVIRYRTGDLVRVNLDRCDCGRTSLRFEGGILGRADDMVTVRGVNVFPAGVENIIRKFTEVDEFRITVNKVKQMDEMDIEVELCDGANPQVVHEIAVKLDSMLAFRPRVHHVARNMLPRFEMKAKRFHVKLCE